MAISWIVDNLEPAKIRILAAVQHCYTVHITWFITITCLRCVSRLRFPVSGFLFPTYPSPVYSQFRWRVALAWMPTNPAWPFGRTLGKPFGKTQGKQATPQNLNLAVYEMG